MKPNKQGKYFMKKQVKHIKIGKKITKTSAGPFKLKCHWIGDNVRFGGFQISHLTSILNNDVTSASLNKVVETKIEKGKEGQILEEELVTYVLIEGDTSLVLPNAVSQLFQWQEPIVVMDLIIQEVLKVSYILGSFHLANEVFLDIDCNALNLRIRDQVVACKEFNVIESPKNPREDIKVDNTSDEEWYKVEFVDDGHKWVWVQGFIKSFKRKM